MRWKSAQLSRIQIFLVVLLVGFSFWALSLPAHAALQKDIESVTVLQDEEVLTVTIKGNEPLTYTAFKQGGPLSVIVDILEADIKKVNFPIKVESNIIREIKGTFFADRPKPYSRIEILLENDVPYTVTRFERGIVIAFQKKIISTPGEERVKEPDQALEATSEPDVVQEATTDQTSSTPSGMAARLPQDTGTIEAIEFKPLGEGRVCVTVKSNRKLPYKVVRIDNNTLLLRLRQAVLPQALARHYDTSYFEGALDRIIPQQSSTEKNTVDITLKMRDEVPFKAMGRANIIQLVFDPTKIPPKPNQLVREEWRPSPESEKTAEADKAETIDKKADFPPEFADLSRDAARLAEDGYRESPRADTLAFSKTELPFGPDKVYTGRKVSLDFQNADIHNVLRILAEVSNMNIVAGEDVSGKVTLKLDKVPWDQALDVVLATNDLGMIRTGNVIRIAPLDKVAEEKRRFIEMQQAEFEARQKVAETEPLVTEYIQVNYAKAEALKDQVERVKSDRGSVTYDERTNKIIIKDTPTVIENAKALVSRLDGPTRQVLIEARIVEATDDFSRQIGVRWGSGSASNLVSTSGGEWTVGAQGRLDSNFVANPNIPSSGDALGAIGFTFGRVGTTMVNLDVRLLALEEEGKVHIISSPKITTLDNKEAYIQQGAKIPYRELTYEGTVTTAFVEATLKLTVVPHITPDDRISLNIEAKKDEPDWTKTVEGVPAVNTREAKTELLINNGETVVIGGIIWEKKTKGMAGVPGLSKIPVLGWLFKGEKKETERTELLIFLSANIVKPD